MKNKYNRKSPYEPQALPGMEYKPRGYEPIGFSEHEEVEKNDLASRIYEKQSNYYKYNGYP